MSHWIKSEVRRFRVYLKREQQYGHKLARTLFLSLPIDMAAKLYRKVARNVNAHIMAEYLNSPRFRSFQRRQDSYRDPCFYVIVMPDVLHFLIPNLRLIPKHIDVVLLHNGSHQWGRDYLTKRFPRFSAFAMWTLPWSSVPHGDVLTLLLRNHSTSFGIMDHDLYIFDHSVFEKLCLKKDEYALGLFRGRSSHNGIAYPHTFFLFLNTQILRELMDKYRVTARIYKTLPTRLQPTFDQLGLTSGIHLKDHHNFFDTLHVLFVLAHAEGFRARFLPLEGPDSVYHVGGTSIGDHRKRDLIEQYIQLRFLECIKDPMLDRRYGHFYKDFISAEEILRRLHPTRELSNTLSVLNKLLSRLEATGDLRKDSAAKTD